MLWTKIKSPNALGYKHYYKYGEFVIYKSCGWWYLYKKNTDHAYPSYSDYIGMFKTMKLAKDEVK